MTICTSEHPPSRVFYFVFSPFNSTTKIFLQFERKKVFFLFFSFSEQQNRSFKLMQGVAPQLLAKLKDQVIRRCYKAIFWWISDKKIILDCSKCHSSHCSSEDVCIILLLTFAFIEMLVSKNQFWISAFFGKKAFILDWHWGLLCTKVILVSQLLYCQSDPSYIWSSKKYTHCDQNFVSFCLQFELFDEVKKKHLPEKDNSKDSTLISTFTIR